MTKNEALARVRQAVVELADARGKEIEQFRAANAHLVTAQLDAANAGASSSEINAASEWKPWPWPQASEWNGVPV